MIDVDDYLKLERVFHGLKPEWDRKDFTKYFRSCKEDRPLIA